MLLASRCSRRCGRYVCGACSPLKLLIPMGQQCQGAKGYSAAEPQRVCLECAPELQPQQEELIARFAAGNQANARVAKPLVQLPFTNSLAKECNRAANIVENFFVDGKGASKDRRVPVALLRHAKGLAFMTVMKAGFLIAGRVGTGLVLRRLPDGSWSAPSAIGTVGLGGGLEIGGETVETMLILGSDKAVQVFHEPQFNLGAGLDVAVGPFGRSAAAAAAVSRSGLNANYGYSMSTGLYAGVSVQGSVISARKDLNRKFYGREIEPSVLLSGEVAQPLAAQPLYDALANVMNRVEEFEEERRQRRASTSSGSRGSLGEKDLVRRSRYSDAERKSRARRESAPAAVQDRRVRAPSQVIERPCSTCDCDTYVPHRKHVDNKRCKRCRHEH